MATATGTSQFTGVDFLNFDSLLSEEERAVRDTVRSWVSSAPIFLRSTAAPG